MKLAEALEVFGSPVAPSKQTGILCNTTTCFKADNGDRGVRIAQKWDGTWQVDVWEWFQGLKYGVTMEANTPGGAVGIAKRLLKQPVIR